MHTPWRLVLYSWHHHDNSIIKHFINLKSCFLKVKTKFEANSLFLTVCHFTKLQQLQKAHNTHLNISFKIRKIRSCDTHQTLGEPGHTQLYAGLPSERGSVHSDLMFFPICRRATFWGLQQTYMNKQTTGSGDGESQSMGTLLRNMEGLPYQGL